MEHVKFISNFICNLCKTVRNGTRKLHFKDCSITCGLTQIRNELQAFHYVLSSYTL